MAPASGCVTPVTALTSEARQAVARLAEAVAAVQPLAGVLPGPVRVVPAGGEAGLEASGNASGDASRDASGGASACAAAPRPAGAAGADRKDPLEIAGIDRLLQRMTERLGMPRLELCPGLAMADLDVFERAVSRRLAPALAAGSAADVPDESLPEVDEVVDETLRGVVPGNCAFAEVRSFDGALLQAYALGEPRDRAVVIASACGGPVELSEPWMRRLAREHFVVTWESRGLFGEAEGFDGLAQDLAAQVGDLLAVMDHFGVATGHLMGLCGGAMIVLATAAARPDRATSLSLWYGDYELGPRCPKTTYQKDLKEFLAMSAEDRALAASLRGVFCRSLLGTPLPDLAHLTLYPYANDELLYRYGRLSGGIMEKDVTPLLGRVAQPALVVTSQDDTKAHPEGSRLVAAGLPDATLHVEPHGDHITLFHAEPAITELAARFIARAG